MAKKSKNKILEEQRKARKSFLELKQMQEGNLTPEPKPSEVAVAPETFKEKRENFWYHYKLHTLISLFIAIVLAVCITQCATRTKYDFCVIYFSYTPVLDTQTELVADYFEKIGKDLNGDGEVNVQVANLSVNVDTSDVNYRLAQFQSLQAKMTSDDAMLYITDEESIKYFDNIGGEAGIFENEPIKFDDEFFKATTDEKLGRLPKDLQITCRRIKNTTLEKSKSAKATYKEAKRIISELEKKMK